jgi:hypothetical protein
MHHVLGALVVDRARCAAPGVAVLVLCAGSGGVGGAGVRDVTDRLVPRHPASSGIAGRLSGRLMDLAEQVRRLDPPSHRDPEAFHITKSDIADELRRVAHDAQQRLAD